MGRGGRIPPAWRGSCRLEADRNEGAEIDCNLPAMPRNPSGGEVRVTCVHHGRDRQWQTAGGGKHKVEVLHVL